MKLLSVNPKVEKSLSHGILTHILHLAPYRLSGYNVCGNASIGCIFACLNAAGRGGIPDGSGCITTRAKHKGEFIELVTKLNNIQRARIRRTKQFFEDRKTFLDALVRDIEAGIKKARRMKLEPSFRLNGTSDLRWELYPVMRNGKTFANIFEAFQNIQFYDYTKMSNRRNIPANYHLTFSLSEDNDAQAIEALRNGMSVAVPLWLKKGQPMPKTWGGFRVIDGDITDIRFEDPRGCIVGLRVKGRVDLSNLFVRDPVGGFRVRSLPVLAVA